jgi:hypothetical protein
VELEEEEKKKEEKRKRKKRKGHGRELSKDGWGDWRFERLIRMSEEGNW